MLELWGMRSTPFMAISPRSNLAQVHTSATAPSGST